MAGSSGQQSSGIISGINVTPLVDVMLVLLVIFIVTAKMIVTPAVPLDLPHAAHGNEVQVVFSVIVPLHVCFVIVNVAPPAISVLPFASFACTVRTCVGLPSAVIELLVGDSVDCVASAGPAL